MNNITKCFLAMIVLIAGSFHYGWALSDNELELINAASFGYDETVDRLLKTNINVNARDDQERTPLMRALANIKCMTLLLAVDDTDINARDNSGYTALMLATCWDLTNAVRMLLEVGADITLKTNGGYTALELALMREKSTHNNEIVKLLRAHQEWLEIIRGDSIANEWQWQEPDERQFACPLDVINTYIKPLLDPAQTKRNSLI